MRFDGFYGNETAKKILSGIFDSRHIPNAILIEGPRGAGKKTLARILSAAAVCGSGSEIPCGKCRQCSNALAGVHPDITFFDCGTSRSFGVDSVRKIRLDAFVFPNDASRKVYILADAQGMTDQAQNALLKIIEEPPDYVLFILTSDSGSNILETVRSRSQIISVGPVDEARAADALTSDSVTREDALRAVRISGGIIGKAKIILDEGFDEISAFISEFTASLCSADMYSFIRLSGQLEKSSGLFTSFIELLPSFFRDAILLKNGGGSATSGFYDETMAISRRTTAKRIFGALNTALESQKAAERYANKTLHLTYLFSQLWQDFH